MFQLAKIYSALISTQKICSEKDEAIQADLSYLPEIDIKISTKPAFLGYLDFEEMLLQKNNI